MDDVIDKKRSKNRVKRSEKYMMPSSPVESIQYDLFTKFYKNSEEDTFSNTVELWDAIPKYYLSRRDQVKRRTKDDLLPVLRREFKIKPNNPNGTENGVMCGVAIQPAIVTQKNGKDKAFYPSEREEIIEKILRKFFEDQNLGFYDPQQKSSWVKFTLKSIQKEMKLRKHMASIQEIKESIDILSSTVLTFYLDGEEYYRDSILSGLIRVNRAKYQDDGNSMWAARLPEMISNAMERGCYNQYDYLTQMDIQSSLARWLHQLLSRRFKHAGGDNWYDIYYTTIMRDSGYLDIGTEQNKRRKVEKALDVLIEKDVILKDYEKHMTKRQSGKITEIKYRIFATETFKKKWVLNNARIKDVSNKLTN